jgi:hypothetical protein
METRSDSPLPAVLLMLAAVALFGAMDAGLKLLAPHYAPMQVATLRGASALPLVLAWALATVGVRGLLHVHWPLHLLRGVLGVAMMAGFVYGLRTLPLTTAYAISFVAPLLVTALAVPILGEYVGPRRWTAIAVGLVGVLVVLRPTGEGMLTLAGLAVLLAAFCYAAGAITVRLLARRDSTQAMVFWFLAILSLIAGVLAWRDWLGLVGDRRDRRLGHARPGRPDRGLPPRRGFVDRPAGIHRPGLGRAGRCRVLAGAAGRGDLGRRRHHRRQRPLPDPARKSQGTGGPGGDAAALIARGSRAEDVSGDWPLGTDVRVIRDTPRLSRIPVCVPTIATSPWLRCRSRWHR